MSNKPTEKPASGKDGQPATLPSASPTKPATRLASDEEAHAACAAIIAKRRKALAALAKAGD